MASSQGGFCRRCEIGAIDRKILPENRYWTATVRTLKRDACLWIAFWFETSGMALAPDARQRMISERIETDALHGPSYEPASFRNRERSKVGIQDIWDEVNARLNELQNAQKMVIEKTPRNTFRAAPSSKAPEFRFMTFASPRRTRRLQWMS